MRPGNKLREVNLAEQFMYVLSKYNVDVIDPDQAYINFLCRDKIKYLPNGWNKEPLPEPAEGGLNIIHYALYKKPWQYDDVIDAVFEEYNRLLDQVESENAEETNN